MAACLCEMLSALRIHLMNATTLSADRGASMEVVMDSLLSRQIQLEIQDRRCLGEARRLRGNKTLFRAKMLEHRRLQAQLVQLQRYRENVQAQQDALSNHEINQTFVLAMQNAVKAHKLAVYTKKDASDTMDEVHSSISSAREMTELLGQPVGEDVLDEELEEEFLEAAGEEQVTLPSVVEPPRVPVAIPAPRALTPLVAA